MPAASVSEEVSHLMKDRGYPQKRAVAAAMSMKRAGKFKRGKTQRSRKRRTSR